MLVGRSARWRRSCARCAGLGIAFVSIHAVAGDLRSGALERFTLRGRPPLRRSLTLARLVGRSSPPAEQLFIETLMSCCAKRHGDTSL
ncbi:MAG: hypothetical protein KGL15_04825 [Acidobacteriota bacterium]|nr:hypothetical protein [Acidobacteriota bacterium]